MEAQAPVRLACKKVLVVVGERVGIPPPYALGRSLQKLHIQFGEMLDDTVKAKRRRRLQESAFLAWITHEAEERLVQSRRVELDKPCTVAG
jgi:hypothetical protein